MGKKGSKRGKFGFFAWFFLVGSFLHFLFLKNVKNTLKTCFWFFGCFWGSKKTCFLSIFGVFWGSPKSGEIDYFVVKREAKKWGNTVFCMPILGIWRPYFEILSVKMGVFADII